MKDEMLIAVSKNEDRVSIVKNVERKEYNRLLNLQEKSENAKEERWLEQYGVNKDIDKKLTHLYGNELLLAKALYDRFVDRGYLDENKEFDKAFFDYVFEGKELVEEDYPEDFKKILAKVVEQ